jgi:predicted transcriptional regulator
MELNARRRIYKTILRFPGLHFRGIQRKTNFGNGGLKYNLDVLEKKGAIESVKYGRALRYYPRGIDREAKKLLALLRLKSVRRILLYLLTHPRAHHRDIANYLERSPSTITWHMKRLAEQGVIRVEQRGGDRVYTVLREDELRRTLVSHRESFLDEMVEGFISLWEL